MVEKILANSIPEPNTGCWLWTGHTLGGVYAGIRFGKKKMNAHRASYLVFRGEIPKGMYVCHKCDTPLCVNPEHLFLGTPSENVKDCVAKSRQVHSKKTHCSKGHAFDSVNTYHTNQNSRKCRVCEKVKQRKRRGK